MYEKNSDFWMAFILSSVFFSTVWIGGAIIFFTLNEHNERIEKLEQTVEQCNKN